jgi:hypothetical protein
MKRTWLSLAGGVLLLHMSLATSFGGLFYVTFSFPANMAEFLQAQRKELDRREQAGEVTPDQKPTFALAREKLDDLERRTSGPAGEAWLARWRPFGYFELFAAALGLVGGLGLLIGGAFGKSSGTLAGLAGAATCLWGSMLGLPPYVSLGVQIPFLLGYVAAILGALSIITEPQPAA